MDEDDVTWVDVLFALVIAWLLAMVLVAARVCS